MSLNYLNLMMMLQRKIEVLLCDDHDLLREGVRNAVRDIEWIEIIAEAENGVECMTLVKELSPDVVLLDFKMPEMNGLECCKLIKKDFPDVKVVVLTEYNDDPFIKQFIKADANGYLKKRGTSLKTIPFAIKKVMDGYIYMPTVDVPRTEEPEDPDFARLTQREKEILPYLCWGLNAGKIAKQLDLKLSTVENHIANMRHKTQSSNVAALVYWASRNDLV